MTEKSGFVFVDLSAQQWGLYDNLPGAKKAGEALNVIVNAEIRDAFIAQSEGVPLHASAKKAMTAVQGFLRSIEGRVATMESLRNRLNTTFEKSLGMPVWKRQKALKRPLHF